MSQAERTPEPSDSSDPVQQFERRYAVALDKARSAASMTAEPAWEEMMSARIAAEKAARASLSKELAGLAETLDSRGWTEEEEKAAKDAIRAAIEARAENDVFTRQVIDPVTAPVRECQEVINSAVRHAEKLQRDQPLIHRNIDREMQDAVDAVAKPVYMANLGIVVIREARQ